MKNCITKLFAAVVAVSFLMPSCATIVSKASYPISINTNPQGAELTIRNKKGEEVYRGVTPATVTLGASSKYMSGERYEVRFTLPGYYDHTVFVNSTLEGWYFGNVLFGGLIGCLIVDPLTGAMYKLDDAPLNVTLNKSDQSEVKLDIIDINTLPQEMRSRVELIN